MFVGEGIKQALEEFAGFGSQLRSMSIREFMFQMDVLFAARAASRSVATIKASSPRSRDRVFGLDAQKVQRQSGTETRKGSKSCKDREYRPAGTDT